MDNKISMLKKRRKTISVAVKLEIIKRFENGDRKSKIAVDFGFAESTVSTIIRYKERIKAIARSWGSVKFTNIKRRFPDIRQEMENSLTEWISAQMQKQITPSSAEIKKKAICLYDALLKNKRFSNSKLTFSASGCWLYRYKKRCGLFDNDDDEELSDTIKMETEENIQNKSLKVRTKNIKENNQASDIEENTDDNCQTESFENFIKNIMSLIIDGKFLPEQIFNVNQTKLLWKNTSEIYKLIPEDGRKNILNSKTNHDSMTLLLGGNIIGDCKLKPLVIYHTENPTALKNVNKQTLPVIWKSNENSNLNPNIFENWFYHSFISQTSLYCAKKRIQFKILLLLEQSSKYPEHLNDFHSNVKVIFIPQNISNSFQSIDERIMNTFKILYLNHIFSQAIRNIAIDNNINFNEFWKSYNIYEAIRNVTKAWEDIKENNIKIVWKNIFPNFISNIENQTETYLEDNIRILRDTIKKILKNQKNSKSQNNDYELEFKNCNDMPQEIIEKSKVFTVEGLEDAFKQINYGLKKLEEMDPNIERNFKISRIIEDALSGYRRIYEDKKNKESSINEPEIQLREPLHLESSTSF